MRKARSNLLVFLKDGGSEIIQNRQIPFWYKIWAFCNGFFPCRGWFHGVNAKNCKQYLTDFDYYRKAPYNDPAYTAQISKENLKKTLHAFDAFLPRYYLTIRQGILQRLEDWPDEIELSGAESVLLEKNEILVMKRVSGRAGAGFIAAKYLGGDSFSFNDMTLCRKEAAAYIEGLDGYLVTEFVEQAETYRDIWDQTTHTLRVQTYKKDVSSPAEIVFAFLRIGSAKRLRAVSHVVSEGIYTTGIEVIAGDPIATVTAGEDGRMTFVEKHADTGKNLQICVPNWHIIAEKCMEMHDRLAKLNWLGWDVVVTDDGFKILEVNTFTGLVAPEAFQPIKTDDRLNAVFCELFKRKK